MSGVQSIERAFAVLRCLSGGPTGVTDISGRVQLPKSTVSRLLSTLEDLGVVEQAYSGGPYRLGEQLIEIAAAAVPRRPLIAAARPHLTELTKLTGEASGLSVLDHHHVHYIDQVNAERAIQIRDWTGERIPAHVVSSGLILLAHAGTQFREDYLSGRLVRFTTRSVVEAGELAARLRQIRTEGHCWVIDEFEEGLTSVAAAIRDSSGRVVAAVHAHGPTYRFPVSDKQDEVTSLVIRAAERISANLGASKFTTPTQVS